MKEKSVQLKAITLADGSILQPQKTLRFLSKRRAVSLAAWQGKPVIAKVFWGAKAKGQLRSNLQGYDYLTQANILSPKLLYQGMNANGDATVAIFELLTDGQIIDETLIQTNVDTIAKLAAVLTQLHQAKLRQKDLHFSNFFLKAEGLFVLDTASISHSTQTLKQEQCLADVIELMLQIPATMVKQREQFLHSYLQYRHWQLDQRQQMLFQNLYNKIQQEKIKRHCKRSLRNTTQNICLKSASQFLICNRKRYEQDLKNFLNHIDQHLQQAQLIASNHGQKILQLKFENKTYQVFCFKQLFFAKRKWLEVMAKSDPMLEPLAFLTQRIAWVLHWKNYIVFEVIAAAS